MIEPTWTLGGAAGFLISLLLAILRFTRRDSPSLWHKAKGLIGKMRTMYLLEADNEALREGLKRAEDRATTDQTEIDRQRATIQHLREELAKCRCSRGQ